MPFFSYSWSLRIFGCGKVNRRYLLQKDWRWKKTSRLDSLLLLISSADQRFLSDSYLPHSRHHERSSHSAPHQETLAVTPLTSANDKNNTRYSESRGASGCGTTSTERLGSRGSFDASMDVSLVHVRGAELGALHSLWAVFVWICQWPLQVVLIVVGCRCTENAFLFLF